MVDFDNPLSNDFLESIYVGKRETIGDDFASPKPFNIGKIDENGKKITDVVKGELGRVWARKPGRNVGDAIQVVNLSLNRDEVSYDRPIMVKKERGEWIITRKAIESANYDAQTPTSPQKPIYRSSINFASVTPNVPETNFFASYRGGIFQLNNEAYRVTDIPSSNLESSVPGANAISIKVEVDPLTSTWYETTGGSFTFTPLDNALKNGDLNTTRTNGRFIIGWIRLYFGQTSIELDDVLIAENLLDLIDDHGAMTGLGDDDHTQYIHIAPDSDIRNIIQSTAGNFDPLTAKNQAGDIGLAVTKLGNVGIGAVPGNRMFYVERNLTELLGHSTAYINSTWAPPSTPTNTTHRVLDVDAIYSSTASKTGWFAGVSSTTYADNTGVMSPRGFNAWVGNAAGGTMISAAAFYARSGFNSGVLTDMYGVYIEDQTAAANNYAWYSNAGNVSIGDTLETRAGRTKNQTRVTTTYVILDSDEEVKANTDAGAYTVTLPVGVSQHFRIVNTGTSGNALTIAPNGAEKIMGANSAWTLFDGDSLIISYEVNDGWY